MASYWFRCYTEIKRDRKLRRLPVAHRWIWVVLMAVAKESPIEGKLLLSEGLPLTIEDIADEAAVDIEDVGQAIERFQEQNMIYEEDGVYVLTNWDDRQFVSDNSTERVKRHRQRKKETPMKRYSNVSVTPPETETETETDIKEEGPESPDAPSTPLTKNERECLKIIKEVPNYSFDYTKDTDHLRSLAIDFPKVDILNELKKWRTYKLDHPLKKNSNARLQIRNWIENADRWNKDERASPEPDKSKFKGIYLT